MPPAAGGRAPAQSAPEPGRSPPPRRDSLEGPDPANAATRKTAWSPIVPPATPAAADAAPAPAGNPAGGGILGGDASWPALADSARARPTSASSDSIKSLSDGSGPSTQEESIASLVPPHPPVEDNPISSDSNPTPEPAPNVAPNVNARASSQQNGAATQTSPARRSGSTGGNNGGGSRRTANSSGAGGSSFRVDDGYWNDGGSGTSSVHNSNNVAGSSSLNDSFRGGDGSGNSSDRSRNSISNNNWNNSIRRGGGSISNGTGRGDGNNRNVGSGSNHWNNNTRNSSGNDTGGRGGYRGRRDHERGGNFSPRTYPNIPAMQYQQQLPPSVYQSGPFRGPPPPPTGHMMMPPHFVAYVPPFAYHADMQSYPLYAPPVEQFQNMHLVRPPMPPAFVPQDQPDLQESIRNQIEFYFSTNNLCHDTFLRKRMNDQGWVPIDLILGFNRMRQFSSMVDRNYILNAIRGSEVVELQGDNIRRRNDWAEWILR